MLVLAVEIGAPKMQRTQDTGKFELPVAVDAPTKSPDDMMDEEWRKSGGRHVLNRFFVDFMYV